MTVWPILPVRCRTDLSPVFLLQKVMNRMTTPNPRNAVTAMSRRRTHARGIRSVAQFALLAGSSSPVLAQVRSGDMPESASPNGYLADGSCGPGWTCNRGYDATDEACIALQVPENANLDYSGNDWECNQPCLKRASGCALR